MSYQSTNGDLPEDAVLDRTTEQIESGATPPAPRLVPRRRRGAIAVAEAPLTAVDRSTDVEGVTPADKVVPVETPAPKWRLPASISWETLAYLVMIALAIGTRFWNLGEKALHHDESLHAYYSWVYSVGDGYRHDPLMHGPFLFHFNALIYLIFGDSDATSRFGPAFFGVLMVAMPWLLRGPRFLGKYGALAASFFILISPSILYQSRYIRHDIYTIGGTLFLFICIFRYLETPQRRWLIAGSATLAFLFTNHEIVFAIAAIFYLFLYAAVMVEQFTAFRRTGDRRAWELAGVHGGCLIGLFLLYALVPGSTRAKLWDIPWENPTRAQENAYYKMFVTNPLVIGVTLLTIAFLAGLWWVLGRARPAAPAVEADEVAAEGAPQPASGRIYYTPDDGFSVTNAVRTAWHDKNGLLLAVGAFLLIFVPLYTSMFTNMAGLRSSTIATDGTLLYWLGQHDYRRGGQPWFYFLLLLPQYEYLVAILGALLALVTGIRAVAALLGWSGGRQLFFRLFLTTWFVLIFAGLSYAGEKMPWLIVHITLPGCLLAAAMVGAMVDMAIDGRNRNVRKDTGAWSWLGLTLRDWALTGGLVLLGAAFVWIAGQLTFGQFVPTGDPSSHAGIRRMVTEAAARDWWRLAIPFLLAGALVVAWVVWRGIQRTSLAVTAALVVGLALLQVHAGWRLSMHDADVPKDMLIYTQTSPDVTRVMNEIDALSEELTGGQRLEVWFDSGVSWPFQWYLRNYDNARFIGASLSQDPGNAPILLLGSSDQSSQYLANYTATDYVLRWWFPEETYRGFAIAPEIPVGRSAWTSNEQGNGPFDILSSIFDTVEGEKNMNNQLRLYRLLMYRDLDWEIGQTPFRLYVRNDLLPLFNSIRYSQ